MGQALTNNNALLHTLLDVRELCKAPRLNFFVSIQAIRVRYISQKRCTLTQAVTARQAPPNRGIPRTLLTFFCF